MFAGSAMAKPQEILKSQGPSIKDVGNFEGAGGGGGCARVHLHRIFWGGKKGGVGGGGDQKIRKELSTSFMDGT